MLSFFDDSQLARDQFKDWLQNQSPTTVVGTTQDGCDCPLARYSNTRAPSDFGWYVSCLYYHDQSDNENEYNLPDWATRFVDRIDGLGKTINAQDALRELEAI